ncbi:MAG: hypothetical protein P4L50_03925 [Anaerolineaceae bacterium]|nr:hypothetical protein [Anaerolineaceae bacterium]
MIINMRLVKITAVLGMLAILAIAYEIDRLDRVLQIESQLFYNPLPLLWLYQLSDEILAACLLLLAWFALFKGNSSLVCGVYLAVGLFIGLYNPLVFTLRISDVLPAGLTAVLMQGNRVALTGAFLTITGLVGLILRRRNILV